MQTKYHYHQTQSPHEPRETLPTMYDLPSENPEEPGLPDEFHDLQPELLRLTFRPANYSPEEIFSGSDLNLYYDLNHHSWYKRPDWFGVVGISRFYKNEDLRLSYVMWQEMVAPTVVVELLSPGTEKEDLGTSIRNSNEPPTKWEVYEQILQIPYYVVFDRYNDQLRAFALRNGVYQELKLTQPRIWIPQLELGLGLWTGEYDRKNRLWLRWYDDQEEWILTPTECSNIAQEQLEGERQRAEAERQRAEAEKLRSQRLEELLRSHGIDPNA
ncbi:MAG: Uma2 family endonuclease [Symploca sp. SIO2C1]|nr:Uma2 family endonuclease [Symploca sp. SIO2C1]